MTPLETDEFVRKILAEVSDDDPRPLVEILRLQPPFVKLFKRFGVDESDPVKAFVYLTIGMANKLRRPGFGPFEKAGKQKTDVPWNQFLFYCAVESHKRKNRQKTAGAVTTLCQANSVGVPQKKLMKAYYLGAKFSKGRDALKGRFSLSRYPADVQRMMVEDFATLAHLNFKKTAEEACKITRRPNAV
jgi:hypothetical protein